MPNLVKVSVGGQVFEGAPMMAGWLPAVIAEGIALGYGSISVFKVYGPYSKSSDVTHEQGLAADVIPVSHVREWVLLFRERGAVAWPRGAAWGSPTFMFHIRLLLNMDDAVQSGYYQILDALRGTDGLADNGPDNVLPHYSGVLAIDGWTAMSTPTKTIEDDDMKFSTINITDGTRVYAVVGRYGPAIAVFKSWTELQCVTVCTDPATTIINDAQLANYDAWYARATGTDTIDQQLATIGAAAAAQVVVDKAAADKAAADVAAQVTA